MNFSYEIDHFMINFMAISMDFIHGYGFYLCFA